MFCIVFGIEASYILFRYQQQKNTKICENVLKLSPPSPCLEWKQCAHHGPSTRVLSLRMLAYGPDSSPRVAITREESCFLTPPLGKRNCSQKACRCFRDFEKKKKSAHRNSFFAVFWILRTGKLVQSEHEKIWEVFKGYTNGKFTHLESQVPYF